MWAEAPFEKFDPSDEFKAALEGGLQLDPDLQALADREAKNLALDQSDEVTWKKDQGLGLGR